MKKIILLCVMCSLLGNLAFAQDETLTFADGGIYLGQVKNGKPHGEGTYTYPDGEKYTGQVKDGYPHGKEILYDPNGKISQKGTFQKGEYTGK